jgi:hypothetical protein
MALWLDLGGPRGLVFLFFLLVALKYFLVQLGRLAGLIPFHAIK